MKILITFINCLLFSIFVQFYYSLEFGNDYFALDDKFIDWFHENGGVTNGVTIYNTKDKGRGLMAQLNIKDNDKLLSIPKSLIINSEIIKLSKNQYTRNIARNFNTEEEVMIAYILIEKIQDEKSFWYPYFNVLPKNISNLSFFSDSELTYLQDNDLINKSQQNKQELLNKYNNFMSKLDSLTSHLTFPSEQRPPILFEDYLWAQAILDSRALRFQGKPNLIPFADMFNYEPHPDTRKAASGEFFLNYHKVQSNGDVWIIADRNHNLNEEIYEVLIYLIYN